MQPIVVNEGPPPWLRWLALPAAILVIVLVAFAVDSESRDEYSTRTRAAEELNDRFEDVEADRFFFRTPEGDVIELSTDESGSITQDADGDLTEMVLEQNADGEFGGVVVNDDGSFSPFRPGDDVAGKTLIVPTADGGFEIVRPDGSKTTISVGPDGIVARDENGQRIDLPRDSDGRVDLGDSVRARDVDLDINLGDTPRSGGGWRSTRTILIMVLGMLGLAAAAWWFIAMKPKFRLGTAEVAPPIALAASHSSAPNSWDSFEQYLEELRANPDPTQAVRLAFAYAEQGMGSLPSRDLDQTPYEWCDSVQQVNPDLSETLRSLADTYSSIRFADQGITSDQRDACVDELRSLVYGACQ